MTTKAILVLTGRLIILAIIIWIVWSQVRLGLPLQWVAIFFGGILAIGNALSFVTEPLIRKLIPDIDARQRKVFGYTPSPRAVIAKRVILIGLGTAAAAWGLLTPL